MKYRILIFTVVIIGVFIYRFGNKPKDNFTNQIESGTEMLDQSYPLSIEYLRNFSNDDSLLVIESTLSAGINYRRYIASYKSEGFKIFGLLTVPDEKTPENGWPVIVFNHGYIPPNQYKTTERYIAYTDAFSKNGYILFRPDYRGHGNSEGEATGGYGSNAYTIDVMNAISAIRKLPDADKDRIGLWGHSMGGFITLRVMVVDKNIKAGVIWAGVVASYPDLLNIWQRRNSTPPPGIPNSIRRWRDELQKIHGTPESNPQFWNSISANSFLSDLSGPVQLHHGTADDSVPSTFSATLKDQIRTAGKTVEYYEYPGDDHNISRNFGIAIKRSVDFFDKYVKGEK